MHTYFVPLLGQPKSAENLHKAVRRGDVEMIQNILDTKLVAEHYTPPLYFDAVVPPLPSPPSPHYIDIPDISGASPLMSACSLGKKE